ncbi:MAG: DUF302 domain-containing protein [Pontiellaceae bacterium]|nr:DUF302 domain-containing protein [Pontiellaceae bacterium]MBN2785483.1 DUF302 domain-containing protein [Pontiellaceae bacterium]
MKKFAIGFVSGIIVCTGIMLLAMPRLMLREIESPLGYEETLNYIQGNVTNSGWKVSATMRLDKSLAKEGRTVLPATSLKICHPEYAEIVLKDDDARFLSVMMPCSIAVYEKTDGKTYISTMNAGLMGRLFGGTAAEVMAGHVADETERFIQFE